MAIPGNKEWPHLVKMIDHTGPWHQRLSLPSNTDWLIHGNTDWLFLGKMMAIPGNTVEN
jgi:hypothetical protein